MYKDPDRRHTTNYKISLGFDDCNTQNCGQQESKVPAPESYNLFSPKFWAKTVNILKCVTRHETQEKKIKVVERLPALGKFVWTLKYYWLILRNAYYLTMNDCAYWIETHTIRLQRLSLIYSVQLLQISNWKKNELYKCYCIDENTYAEGIDVVL